MTLAGRVAIVTGAGAPVGRAVALALGRAGAAVGLVGPDEAGLAGEGLSRSGVDWVAAPAALHRRPEVEAAFTQVVAELGPLHLAVHAWWPASALERSPLVHLDEERWDGIWETTMTATVAFLQASLAAFGGAGGRVVIVTPTVWTAGVPGLAAWSAAVEGQRALAKSAARQWGSRRVLVNCLAPAWQSALARDEAAPRPGDPAPLADAALGEVDLDADVGGAVVALASAEAGALTGATVCVDGGVAMAP